MPFSKFSRALKALLYVTTSFSVIALSPAAVAQAPNTQPAAAPAAPGAATTPAGAAANLNLPPEQVLITGSLIRGAVAVGVPVTSLRTTDFQETGSLTVSDLLKNVPAIQVTASASTTSGGGNAERASGIDIHNLNAGSPRTLMLIDGLRYPLQTHDTSAYDPSIIPELAIDRIDVLADGASATYGSDAIAGVVNVILKRGFEGAITQGRISYQHPDGYNWQASQLYGTKWDGGDITVSYEHYSQNEIKGPGQSFITYDFRPWGLNNTTPVRSSIPGTVSIGSPSPSTGTTCANCFAVPLGTAPNTVLSWAALQNNAGTNVVNPYAYGDLIPASQRNAATFTFDQDVFPNVQVFADGFYSNRRSQQFYPETITPYGTNNVLTIAIPTSNPFYPTGAPAGVRVSYNFAMDIPPRLSSFEISNRIAVGANVTLPGEWLAKIFLSRNEEHGVADAQGLVNANNASAALGATISAKSGLASYTKPANVPYLNLFCDPTAFTCNDPATLDYISGFRRYDEHYVLRDVGINLDGPVFSLPGGDVRAAIGADYNNHSYSFLTTQNFTTASTTQINSTLDSAKRDVWAAFAQVNVPIFGEANAIPFIQRLNFEAAIRYDHYSDFGGTTNPKVALDWKPVDDLTLRASWGTSFRAPAFADISPVAGKQVQAVNLPAGASVNDTPACLTVGSTPVPGSAAEILNPTCSAALQYQGGITSRGGTPNGFVLFGPGFALGPEQAHNYNLGFDYTPASGPLAGVNVFATYFRNRITGALQGFDTTVGAGLNDPTTRFTYILPTDPNFAKYVQALYTDPNSTVTGPISSIAFINAGNIRNTGSVTVDGMDFGASYDKDFGDWGAWNVGITGTRFFSRKTIAVPGTDPRDDFNVDGQTQMPRTRYRARLGWADGAYSATLFMNYQSHFYTTEAFPPACFISGAPCAPGAAQFPNYSSLIPSFYTFDLSLGYTTGETPASPWLRGIGVQLVANNLFDRNPPFAYKISRTGGTAAYYGSTFSPMGRVISLIVTKEW